MTKPDLCSPSLQDSASCCSPSGSCCQQVVPAATTASASGVSATYSERSRTDEPESGYSVDRSAASLRTLTIHRDNRGNVRETFRASWFPALPPIKQLVRSKSKPKTIRG